MPTDANTSKRMRSIRQKGTAPELAVRAALRGLRVGYRTQGRDLPGSPDIVNRRAQWAIFVHGCFWHGHEGCRLYSVPKTNPSFWEQKVAANRLRDERKVRELAALGYRVLTIWQCATKDQDTLERILSAFLSEGRP